MAVAKSGGLRKARGQDEGCKGQLGGSCEWITKCTISHAYVGQCAKKDPEACGCMHPALG